MKILCVAGTRPNYMKVAPILRELRKRKTVECVFIHTGQHYDKVMSDIFLEELGIPKPTYYLGAGPGSYKEHIAKIMQKFEEVISKEKPDMVIVVGDVTSTLACALAAVKLGVKVAHIESGLRSFNWKMLEEINRVLTDRISDFLFTTEPSANKNLADESIPKERIFFVGNIMINSLLENIDLARKRKIVQQLGLEKGEYTVLTLHRPENVDHKVNLEKLLELISKVQKSIKIVYPIHPRTKKNLEKFGLMSRLKKLDNVIVCNPLSYLDFLNLMMNSKFIMTDSGGIQEETTALRIPCLTLRGETERPITVEMGTNTIIGLDKEKAFKEVGRIMSNSYKKGRIPKYWDHYVSKRIVDVLCGFV